MTANPIEPVTPRLHANQPITSTRTWHRPQIRFHNAALSTTRSATPSLNSNDFRSTRIRVKEQSVLETTPVTHSTTPKPLKFRIAGKELHPDNVCRQLFPTPRPPKRPRNAAPSFRFSCGRERTQPTTESNGRGQYADALLADTTQALRNARIFSNAVTSTTGDANLETAMGVGLLLELFDRQNEFLLLRSSSQPHGEQPVDVALVMPDELISKLVVDGRLPDLSQTLIYIPYPWHAHVVDEFTLCRSRILITGYTADFFRKEHIPSHESLGKFAILALQPFMEQTSNVRQCGSGPLHESENCIAAVSPHVTVTNLSIYVDFYNRDHHIAIIRDDAGEFAVLLTKNDQIRPRSEKYNLTNVSILPYRIPPLLLFRIAENGGNEEVQSRLERMSSNTSCRAFQY